MTFKRRMEAEANHSVRRQTGEGFLSEGGQQAVVVDRGRAAEERIQV